MLTVYRSPLIVGPSPLFRFDKAKTEMPELAESAAVCEIHERRGHTDFKLVDKTAQLGDAFQVGFEVDKPRFGLPNEAEVHRVGGIEHIASCQ